MDLWSFEVKKEILRRNVRKVFFQTVSNSSWANFGYLVSPVIDTDARTELTILSSLHGIGFIRLDVENPSRSEIVISSRERKLDWDNTNRIIRENKDFKDYIQLVNDFQKIGKLHKYQWDIPESSQ